MVGVTSNRSTEDELMCNIYRRNGIPIGKPDVKRENAVLYIVDARKVAAAEGNRIRKVKTANIDFFVSPLVWSPINFCQ